MVPASNLDTIFASMVFPFSRHMGGMFYRLTEWAEKNPLVVFPGCGLFEKK